MIVLLLTLGVLIPISSLSPAAVCAFRAAIVVVTLMSLYFLGRMKYFGNIVNMGVNRKPASARLIAGMVLVLVIGAVEWFRF